MPFFSSFLISFLLTLVLEYPIILLFRIQKKKDLLLVLLVNLLTNPAAVAITLFLQTCFSLPWFPVQILLELAVIVTEGKLYDLYGRKMAHPFLLSLCANGFSYSLGLLLQYFL